MRYFLFIAVLAVLALAIRSDGAPKLARIRKSSDFIHFKRDSALVNRQQLPGRDSPPVDDPQRHTAPDSRIVFPSTADDFDQIVATGVNSFDGLIQDSNFVPGFIYTGGSQPPAAPPLPRTSGDVAVRQAPSDDSTTPSGSPSSRCILCGGGGSCPDCYQLDQNGVCRPVYGCQQ